MAAEGPALGLPGSGSQAEAIQASGSRLHLQLTPEGRRGCDRPTTTMHSVCHWFVLEFQGECKLVYAPPIASVTQLGSKGFNLDPWGDLRSNDLHALARCSTIVHAREVAQGFGFQHFSEVR